MDAIFQGGQLEEDTSECWDSLPAGVLEAIGSALSKGADASAANLVCKSWHQNMTHGIKVLELDMHPDPQQWGHRLEGTANLLSLRSATVWVNNSVPSRLLSKNIESIRQQLSKLEELHLRLTDNYELGCDAARALGTLSQLRALSIVGGSLVPGAAIQLLVSLAQSPRLGQLSLLPAGRGGLGDEELIVLGTMSQLTHLEFRAHRLTSQGLESLSQLPALHRLAISSLEADAGVELSSLARMACLQHLDLALDQGGGGQSTVGRGGPLGPLAPLAAPADADRAGSELEAAASRAALSLHFKWTDRAAGLLRACQSQLGQNLTALDMGACRVSSEAVFSALAELTTLKQLQMSLYCNNDTPVLCELSQFSRLAALHTLQLVKQAAYYPEHRAFRPSSLSIPITPHTMTVLAQHWGSTLTELRLSLTRNDYGPHGLRPLKGFTRLRSLAILVEGPALPACSGPISARAHARSNSLPASHTPRRKQTPSEDGELDSGVDDDMVASSSSDGGDDDEQQEQEGVWGSPSSGLCAAGQELPGLGSFPADLGSPLLSCSAPMSHGSYLPHRPPQRTQSSERLDASVEGSGHTGGSPRARDGAGGASCARRFGRARSAGYQGIVVTLDVLDLPPGLVHLELAGVMLITPPTHSLVAPPDSPTLPLSLPPLESLSLEACALAGGHLSSLTTSLVPSLASLQLVSLIGLNNANLAALGALTRLTSLVVFAPGNAAVTQAGMAPLSRLRGLKHLSWHSDDLTNLGPVPCLYSAFSSLRMLSLSCTYATLSRAVPSSLAWFAQHMPYCCVDLVGGVPVHVVEQDDADAAPHN